MAVLAWWGLSAVLSNPHWEVVGALALFLGGLFLSWRLYQEHRRDKALRQALMQAGADRPMSLTPEQYEEFCAILLRQQGWTARVTQKSHDYGADIVAQKDRRHLVVQCKRWANSVGVSAVQEIHSAKAHYKAEEAVVVATSGFTPAARELAKSTGVRLVAHTDFLSRF